MSRLNNETNDTNKVKTHFVCDPRAAASELNSASDLCIPVQTIKIQRGESIHKH